jgi:signal transduction histidine kinase
LAELAVVDDGPGVRPEDRERIFDRFYRGEPSRARDGGSGLGLSIARGLAERNGGRVDLVDSTSGTTLRLRLPQPRRVQPTQPTQPTAAVQGGFSEEVARSDEAH